ncbi:MAG TPA: hypothetical protein VF510_17425 [Ktedonobacterales bacterium]
MSRVRSAVAAAQRRWWLAALLVLLVAAGSLVQHVGAGVAQRDSYIATRSLRIVVIPSGASTAYDGYVAARQEDEIARMLTTDSLLSNGRLDDGIAVRMRSHGVRGSLSTLASTAADALSATHSGNLVTLTARGRTTAEADAVATAAVETLSSPVLASFLPSALIPQSDDALLVQAEGTVSPPVRDATQDEAAVWRIATRIAIAFVAGVFLTLLVGWWMLRPQAPRRA